MLSKAQIDASGGLTERVHPDQMSNFEQRMVAEVKLYWIIYEHTSNTNGRQQTETALNAWRRDWQPLFGMFECHHPPSKSSHTFHTCFDAPHRAARLTTN